MPPARVTVILLLAAALAPAAVAVGSTTVIEWSGGHAEADVGRVRIASTTTCTVDMLALRSGQGPFRGMSVFGPWESPESLSGAYTLGSNFEDIGAAWVGEVGAAAPLLTGRGAVRTHHTYHGVPPGDYAVAAALVGTPDGEELRYTLAFECADPFQVVTHGKGSFAWFGLGEFRGGPGVGALDGQVLVTENATIALDVPTEGVVQVRAGECSGLGGLTIGLAGPGGYRERTAKCTTEALSAYADAPASFTGSVSGKEVRGAVWAWRLTWADGLFE